MAKLYKEIDDTLFGPVNLPTLQQNTNQLTKEEQKDVRKKFKKQAELFKKAKEIRQLISKAIVSGSRSGSGKIVFEHYDTLVKICLATSQPLPFGTSSSTNMLADIETMNDDSSSISDDNESNITEDYDENQP